MGAQCSRNKESCSVMNAGAEVGYQWAESDLHKKPSFFFSSRRRHTRFLNVTGVQTCVFRSHSEISYAVFCLRSEKHTSELKSHSELSYAVFCLKKKNKKSKLKSPSKIS